MKTLSQTRKNLDLSETLIAIGKGENARFESLFKTVSPSLYSHFKKRGIQDPNLRDELVQETMVSVFRSAKSYEPEGSALAWILRIADRRYIDYIRSQRTRSVNKPVFFPLSHNVRIANNHQTPLDYLEQKETSERNGRTAAEILSNPHIPGRERDMLLLRYCFGQTAKQVARQFDVSISSIQDYSQIGRELAAKVASQEPDF